MNGSTSVSFGESGAKDAIHEYWQKPDISASEELTNVYGRLETRKPETVAICNRTRFVVRIIENWTNHCRENRIDRTSLGEHGFRPAEKAHNESLGSCKKIESGWFCEEVPGLAGDCYLYPLV
jgi:hypothetical protein